MALFRTGLYVKNHSVEKVQVASTPIASYNGNVTGLYIPELIAYITAKQSGSGTPSPDNIRPFIGVSECNVARCGKNIWSYGDVSGTQRVAVTVDIKAGTYTVSANVTSSDTDYDYNLMLFYYEDRTTESVYINRGTRQNATVTLSKNVTSINFYASRGNNVSIGDTFSFTDIQLEVGSQVTNFEPYTGNTYTIQLGDTYYGGSLDVTTGELTILYKLVLLNGSQTIYSSNWGVRGYVSYNPSDIGITEDFTSLQSDCYGATGTNKISIYNNRVLINDSRIGDTITEINEWNANLVEHNVQVMYELATPITVQLSPTQVEQLLANNVFADTGDVEVKFYNVIR